MRHFARQGTEGSKVPTQYKVPVRNAQALHFYSSEMLMRSSTYVPTTLGRPLQCRKETMRNYILAAVLSHVCVEIQGARILVPAAASGTSHVLSMMPLLNR